MLLTALLLSLIFIATLGNILFHVPLKKLPVLVKSLFAVVTAREQERLQKRKEQPTMSAKRREELKSVFAMFDRNHDGLIAREELGESLRGLGISVSDADLEEAVIGSDTDGDGRLDLDEFCSLLESLSTANANEREARRVDGDFCEGDGWEVELKEAFDVFDRDRDGVITVEELGLVLSSLGMSQGKRREECQEMIRKVDADGDGMVNFDEFKRMMKG
ncbi:hypothetical protein EUGRSUZ_H00167, partial [Eucalyptus grandis]